MTTGVLLMAHGTPASTSQIAPFYTRIRRGSPPSAEQLAELRVAAAAELSFAGLDQQFIAGFEILELDLAAGGVEIMPFGGLDLVAIFRHHAVNVGRR